MPFVGVDGEGGDDGQGRHRYGALRVGSDLLQNDAGLSSEAIFDFLLAQPKGRYVGFSLTYDWTHWLYDVPFHKLQELRTQGFVWWNGYRLDCVPRKLFSVTRDGSHKFTVYDVWGLFQSSFVGAINAWGIGTEEQRAQVAAEKARRSTFVLPIPSEVLDYNALEVDLLEQLMEKVDQACIEAGLLVQRWHGAGALADEMLHMYGVDNYRGELPDEVQYHADRAYFGGRFDLAQYGNVGDLWEYDIASAYPWAMCDLPCLVHGRWESVAGSRLLTGTNLGLIHVRWRHSTSRSLPWSPFPWRLKDGRIVYPRWGDGWYHADEVRKAVSVWANYATFDVGEAWQWQSDCDHQPFAFIPEVYAERLRLGKSEKGKVLKLAMNSLYGKAAQQVGKAAFSQPVWAGTITARTRARLMDAMALAGEHGVMCATDGFYCTKELVGLDEGKNLGQWEKAGPFHDGFVAQAGLYFGHGLEVNKARSRGVSKRIIDDLGVEGALRQQWNNVGMFGRVDLADLPDADVLLPKQLITWQLAAITPKQYMMRGQWVPLAKEISLWPSGDRRIVDVTNEGRAWLLPPSGYSEPSAPRQKKRAQNKIDELPQMELDLRA